MTVVFLICATVTSACAQEKPKRMIPGPSVKELVPESPNEKEDGVAQITLGELFKPGSTEYTHAGANALKDAPPLPTGYVLFKDLVYRIKTEAITASSQLIVFNVPSVENETDFSKLSILHLEDDEMSPSGSSWAEVTVFRGGWDEHFHFVPKAQYDALQPDFKSRRIAAITGPQFGVFAIALAPESQSTSTGPFTQIEVAPSSSPEPVRIGDEVTHTIVIENKGPKPAAEVNIKEEFGNDLYYTSASSTQGTCNHSTKSNGRVLCHLGSLPAGATATITIVARLHDNPLTKDGSKLGNQVEVNFKENSTDFVEADNQIFKDFTTTITRKQ